MGCPQLVYFAYPALCLAILLGLAAVIAAASLHRRDS